MDPILPLCKQNSNLISEIPVNNESDVDVNIASVTCSPNVSDALACSTDVNRSEKEEISDKEEISIPFINIKEDSVEEPLLSPKAVSIPQQSPDVTSELKYADTVLEISKPEITVTEHTNDDGIKQLKMLLATQEKEHKEAIMMKAAEIKKLQTELPITYRAAEQLVYAVEDYEKSIASAVNETKIQEQLYNKERDELIRKTNIIKKNIDNIEAAYNDCKQKCSRTETLIHGMKENENRLKDSVQNYMSIIKKEEEMYQSLKSDFTSELDEINQEITTIKLNHGDQVSFLMAMAQQCSVDIKLLEEQLQQVTRRNSDVELIFDKLNNKFGKNQCLKD